MTDEDTTPFLDDLSDIEDAPVVEPEPDPTSHSDEEIGE